MFLLPSDYPHVIDLLPSIYYAIFITFVRFALIEPAFTWLGCRAMNLQPMALAAVNASTRADLAKQRIPPKVMATFENSAVRQSLVSSLKVTPANRESVAIKKAEVKAELDRLLASLSSEFPSASLREWSRAIRLDKVRSSKLKKFNEAGWRFAFYFFIWLLGFWVLSGKSWFRSSIHEVWRNYPFQAPDSDIKVYYLLSLGHYIHLCFSQFSDVKRKDFWEMMIHHVVTILLIVFSYGSNFIRVGSLVLLVHDGSDVFLELAKLFNYCKYQNLCDFTFVCFAISFFVCRLLLFPFRIIFTTGYSAAAMVGPDFSYYFFNGLLISLLALHIFWFSIIVKMVWNFLKTGLVAKDARSESDEEEEINIPNSPTSSQLQNSLSPSPSSSSAESRIAETKSTKKIKDKNLNQTNSEENEENETNKKETTKRRTTRANK